MSTLNKFLLFCIVVIAEIIYVYFQSDSIYTSPIDYPNYSTSTTPTISKMEEPIPKPIVTHLSSNKNTLKAIPAKEKIVEKKENISFKLKENTSLVDEKYLKKTALEANKYRKNLVTPIVKIQTHTPNRHLGSKTESEEYLALYKKIIDVIEIPSEKTKNKASKE